MSEKLIAQTEKNEKGYFDLSSESFRKNGSSRRHNLISTNTLVGIGSRVRGGRCEIYSKDMCVRVGRNFFSYPDVVIVSGEPKFLNDASEVLLNPTIVIEIVSKETALYDRTAKLESYLATESVKEVLLINETEMRVEHYFKQNQKQWIYRIYDSGDDVVSLDSINCKVSLSEIYSQVRLESSSIDSQAVN
ncbi:MAG: Uma2 family endonuclease [Pyrinomonadaceae bacterium]|nr:Uma2 family endonuclease [Pyrinomonadaceae bacterium]MCX7639341.1 Uma2 family endonuclease [Pyrinomonadaceae bacterium]MDW8305243.1 Uma2 family endonuclease [Acidobacteriota bacterium]